MKNVIVIYHPTDPETGEPLETDLKEDSPFNPKISDNDLIILQIGDAFHPKTDDEKQDDIEYRQSIGVYKPY